MVSLTRQYGEEMVEALRVALPELTGDCCDQVPQVRYVIYPTVDRLLLTVTQETPLLLVRPLTAESVPEQDDRCSVLLRLGYQVDLLFKLSQYKPAVGDEGLQGPILYEHGDFEEIDGCIKLLEDVAAFLVPVFGEVEISLLFDEPILVAHQIFHGAISVKQDIYSDRGGEV